MNPVHKFVVEEQSLKIETDDPTNTLIEPKHPVTGQKMPARYLIPDEGWDHHPGKVSWKPDLSKYTEALRQKFNTED